MAIAILILAVGMVVLSGVIGAPAGALSAVFESNAWSIGTKVLIAAIVFVQVAAGTIFLTRLAGTKANPILRRTFGDHLRSDFGTASALIISVVATCGVVSMLLDRQPAAAAMIAIGAVIAARHVMR